jgi:hypothetical protein
VIGGDPFLLVDDEGADAALRDPELVLQGSSGIAHIVDKSGRDEKVR